VLGPADVDEDGHGTHVAGTVGAPLNGGGISGVAPRVELVNLRAGQDSGYFFLQGTVDALTYAGNNDVDVVNMSFYVDPCSTAARATRPTRPRRRPSSARSSRASSAHSPTPARAR